MTFKRLLAHNICNSTQLLMSRSYLVTQNILLILLKGVLTLVPLASDQIKSMIKRNK